MALSFQMEDPVVGGYIAAEGGAAARHRPGLRRRCLPAPAVLGGSGIGAERGAAAHPGYERDFRSEMALHRPGRARALLDLHGYVDRDGDGWREAAPTAPLNWCMAGTATLNDRRQRGGSAAWTPGPGIRFEVASWPELLKKSRAGTLMMWGYT